MLVDIDINSLDWKKTDGLLPVIVQNEGNGQVLMLVFVNREALIATLTSGQLTIYDQTSNRLQRQGEESGVSMAVQHISVDCDSHSLLIQVIPKEHSCHLGNQSCYTPPLTSSLATIDYLINHINEQAAGENKHSYTLNLINSGIQHCAQKLGEEAIETVIAAIGGDQNELINESADLLYHFLVLLRAANLSFYEVLSFLKERDSTVHT
jgi:phosphoribosyl-ATP pyrophosphohydrolase/phosphoribosyl-AMP cyclohydrolase